MRLKALAIGLLLTTALLAGCSDAASETPPEPDHMLIGFTSGESAAIIDAANSEYPAGVKIIAGRQEGDNGGSITFVMEGDLTSKADLKREANAFLRACLVVAQRHEFEFYMAKITDGSSTLWFELSKTELLLIDAKIFSAALNSGDYSTALGMLNYSATSDVEYTLK